MTGSCRRGGGHAPGSHVHVLLACRPSRNPLPRHAQVRADGAVSARTRDGEPVQERRSASGDRRGAALRRLTRRAVRGTDRPARPARRLKTLLMNQDFLAGVENIYAEEISLPGRGSTRSATPTRLAPTTSAACMRPSETSWPRRSSGAAARSTTTRLPEGTARCRIIWPCTSAPAKPASAAAGRSAGCRAGDRRTSGSWSQRLRRSSASGGRFCDRLGTGESTWPGGPRWRSCRAKGPWRILTKKSALAHDGHSRAAAARRAAARARHGPGAGRRARPHLADPADVDRTAERSFESRAS